MSIIHSTTRAFDMLTAFQAEYGFIPTRIFCQFTGKPIGSIDHSEFESLCDTIHGEIEEAIDDLAIRIFASMRPSMKWNKFRLDTLDDMRKSAPVETLAYLLNRAFTPLSNGGSILAVHHDRIKTYQWCSELSNEQVKRLLDIFLEIDARNNLNEVFPNISVDILLSATWESLIADLTKWYESQMEIYWRRTKQEEMTTRWYRSGNGMAKGAFFNSFMESKPPTPKTEKEAAKRKDSAFLDNVLASLLKPEGNDLSAKPDLPTESQSTKAVSVPSTKMPLRFGVKRS